MTTPGVRVAISLGSNQGDRAENLRRGIAALEDLLEAVQCSAVFETDPMHLEDQPRFLNACCVGYAGQAPLELLARLKRIEAKVGRNPDGPRYGPRPLDLDLLLYGDKVCDTPELTIPHPRLRERPFVLLPLSEVAPEWVVPAVEGASSVTVADLAEASGRRGIVSRWAGALAVTLAVLVVACGPAQESADVADQASSSPPSAEETLRARAAELLPVVEDLSGLPAREPLRIGVRSKEDLEAFLVAELAEQFDGDRIRHMMRVYARLGLVPQELELEPLLRRLLLEQVVGFYDPASDTLFVVDGVASELVDGVLVHEMVHALQDQYVDLDSLTDANRDANDASMAVQAALEGHATFVMVEWMMGEQLGSAIDLTLVEPLGKTLGENPAALFGSEMPELAGAPTVIREQLLFPYVAGLDFVQARWGSDDGRVPPLGESLPSTTEQILHPAEFRSERALAPSRVTFDAEPPDGWIVAYEDGLGEFDTRMFLREHLRDRQLADNAAAGWAGDRYRLLDGPDGESLEWISRWDSESDARDFAAAAQRAFRARQDGANDRSVSVRLIARDLVRVSDAPAPMSASSTSETATHVGASEPDER
jgi:2-amino-4-hydroxy-6-hydroxymethyldihydropteridine diphosphokinase